MNPICTILVVTYNHGKYIAKALDSILCQQTGYNYIIKVFDDASTDDTKCIIKKYQDRFPDKIQCFIASENQGAQANFWTAITSVDSKYFMILEGDDYWCDNRKLQLQIDALEKNPECSFCGHNTYLKSLDEQSREYKEDELCCSQKFLKNKTIFTYQDFKNISDGGYIPYVSARLIRSNVLDLPSIKYKESILFDFTQFYYLLLKGNYYYIDLPMSVYQRTGGGVCSGKNPMDFLNVFIQNAIDFNRQTNNIIADKIFSDCMLQIGFRLQLYQRNYIKTPLDQVISEQNNTVLEQSHAHESVLIQELYFSNDQYYYLCNGGIEHTLTICRFIETLEKVRGAKICLLIQEEQKFIPLLYGVNNYLIVDIKDVDVEALSDRYPNPKLGKIYVTHPFAHKEARLFYEPMLTMTSTTKYVPWLCDFLGISPNDTLKKVVNFSNLVVNEQKITENVGSLDKVVLFLPESDIVPYIDEGVWEKKALHLKKQGYTVISCPKTKEWTIKGTQYVELTIEEILYVGIRCHSIYALRNGLCELLMDKGMKLNVYYPSHSSHYIYSLNTPGKLQVNEELILKVSKRNKGGKLPEKDLNLPLLFGVIRIPNRVYNFYDRNRTYFSKVEFLKKFIKWM